MFKKIKFYIQLKRDQRLFKKLALMATKELFADRERFLNYGNKKSILWMARMSFFAIRGYDFIEYSPFLSSPFPEPSEPK